MHNLIFVYLRIAFCRVQLLLLLLLFLFDNKFPLGFLSALSHTRVVNAN